MDLLTLLSFEKMVSSLAMTLVHFCWQGALIALILKTLLLLAKKQALKLRYYAAFLALVACVLAPAYTFVSLYQSSLLQTKTNSSSTIDLDTKAPQLVINSQALNPLPQSSLSHSPIQQSNILPSLPNHNIDFQLLVALWGLGVLLMFSKLLYDLKQTYRLVRVGTGQVSDDIANMVKRSAERLGINRKVEILKSSLVDVPVVIGWLKPTILLPIAITIGLDRQQLELIIAHELAHVKRFDFLVNLVQGVVQVFFFYHPAIYWVNKVVREEREYICDSMALATLKNQPDAKLELAKALLNIAELKEGNLSLVAVAASDGHLKNRINRILLSEKLRMPSLHGLFLVLLGMLFSVTSIAVTSELSKVNNNEIIQVAKSPIKTATVLKSAIPAAKRETAVAPKAVKKQTNVKKPFKSKSKKPIRKLISQRPLTSESKTKIKAAKTKIAKINATKTKALKAKVSKSVTSNKQTGESLFKEAAVIDAGAKIEKIIDKPIVKLEGSQSEKQTQLKVSQKIEKVALLNAKPKPSYQEPIPLATPYPNYPQGAYKNNLKGRVQVDFIISENGRAVSPKFTKHTPWVFVREIKDKLKKWRYQPAVKEGKVVASTSRIYFDFELPDYAPLPRHQVGTNIKRRIR